MRLTFSFIILLIFMSCKPSASKNKSASIILDYINSTVTQENYDTRTYNPPPPPELKENNHQEGAFKQDSIINKLDPLHLFISDSIVFSKTLMYKKTDHDKRFSFLKNRAKTAKNSLYLDISTFKERKGIVLERMNDTQFFNRYPEMKYENNYGGFLSFHNLIVSKNGEKAYFEVLYFKHKLNASTYVVFAEFRDGKWTFKSEVISIS